MFDMFKKPKEYWAPQIPPLPQVTLPDVKEEICYMVGKASDGKIAFRMGYSTLTMTKKGCENLIEQLQVFVDQMEE